MGYEQVFKEGQHGYLDCLKNPYFEGTPEFDAWEDGWIDSWINDGNPDETLSLY